MSTLKYYYATLILKAHLGSRLREGESLVDPVLVLGDHQLPLRAFKSLKTRLQAKPDLLGEEVYFSLFPKTTREGKLSDLSHVIWLGKETEESKNKEGFKALGELRYVSKEEAFFVLKIWPNPDGRLKKSFNLALLANLDLLESLPPVGSGLEVWGEIKPKSLRIMVTSFEQLDLPPKSKLALAEGRRKRKVKKE